METCANCNEEIKRGNPFQPIGVENLCHGCVFEICENWIEINHGGWALFWLEQTKNRYFKRRTRNTYLPRRLREEVLKKYKMLCQSCGAKERLSIDHIKPVSKGGTDDATNLTVLCRSCNSKKGNKYGTKKNV